MHGNWPANSCSRRDAWQGTHHLPPRGAQRSFLLLGQVQALCLCRTPIGSNNHPFALQKLEDCDRKAVHQIDQLQREQRHLKRRLEKLGAERTRMDSVGSVVSSERSDSDRGESHLPEGLQPTEPTPEQIS